MNKKKIKVALVGYGYWGPNLLRNLIANGDADVIGVIEGKAEARAKCASIYPHIQTYSSLEEFQSTRTADAVVIATPPSTHCELAIKCLKAGAHILVEKPLAMSTFECDKILAVAKEMNRQVMMDHTFAFHPAVDYLVKSNDRGDFGELLYYDSVRVNLGGFQSRTNSLWDLAPHDLSILDLLLKGKMPLEVSAVGIRHCGSTVENLCYLNLRFEGDFLAHLNLNWMAPVKVRTIMIGGSKKMAIYDDNLPSEKIKIYDKSVTLTSNEDIDLHVNYRMGDMIAPAISTREALQGVVAHFFKSITYGTPAICDGEAGRRVVQILEAASLSMSAGGWPVDFRTSQIERRKPLLDVAA